MSSTHSHPRTGTAGAAKAGDVDAAILDLQRRVLALESPIPPTPQPIPPTAHPPIILTAADNGATFSDISITSTTLSGAGIQINGTVSAHVKNITLIRPHVDGFNFAVLSYFCDGLVIQDPVFHGQGYAGVAMFSGSGLNLTNPSIANLFRPPPYTDPGWQNNAYGVMLNVVNPSDPVPDTCTISGGTFTNASTLWMAINAHAGRHVRIIGNTISGVPRAIFVAKTPGATLEDFTITDNHLLNALTVAGGTTDKTAISYGSLVGGLIDRNSISASFSGKVSDISAYTGAGPSSGVVIGTNPSVP